MKRKAILPCVALIFLIIGCSSPSAQLVNMNLPLVVEEVTYGGSISTYSSAVMYINSGDILGTSSYGNFDVIDMNVRSVCNEQSLYEITFYIKDDNSLWGYGSNENGILGDGTGVDREEPVKIMDDAATVSFYGNRIYAVKTDKTLWVWGGGIFEPRLLTDNVVKTNGSLVLKSDGTIHHINPAALVIDGIDELDIVTGAREDSEVIQLLRNTGTVYPETQTQDFVIKREFLSDSSECFWIDADGALWLMAAKQIGSSRNYHFSTEKIYDSNVIKVFESGHFITDDNSLWGYGNNSNGQLGDGTKVPRNDEPVYIADNVAGVFIASDLSFEGENFLLKINGDLWRWTGDDPTPQKVLENVHSVFSGGYRILLNNGQVLGYNREIDIDDVRIPQIIVYP